MEPRRPPSPPFDAPAAGAEVTLPLPAPLPPLGPEERFFRVKGTTTLEKPNVSAS